MRKDPAAVAAQDCAQSLNRSGVRFVAMTPSWRISQPAPCSTCFPLTTVAAALLYRYLVTRSERPRAVLSMTLFVLAIVALLTVFAFGSHGLAFATAPTFLAVPIAIAILVPAMLSTPGAPALA